MNEALAAAQADIQFQFFLARLFGQFIRKASDTHEVQGYAWRGSLYIVKAFHCQLLSRISTKTVVHRSLSDF